MTAMCDHSPPATHPTTCACSAWVGSNHWEPLPSLLSSLTVLRFQNPYDPGAGGSFGDEGYDFDNSASYNMNVNSASVRAGLPTTPAVNLGRPNTGAQRMGMGTAMGRGMMGTAAGMPLGTGMKPPGTGAVGVDGTRPMTSMQGAGYSSSTKKVFDPMGQGQARGPAEPLQKRSENSPEDLCRELEKQVNILIEEASIANHNNQKEQALEKAKEAGKKERQLCREREKNGLADQINSDLTYAVCFNLANQYDACGMHTEALNTYSLIVKDKNYPNAGRLRVNMGNIYFSQQKYPNAIKMYRMAMDQVSPSTEPARNPQPLASVSESIPWCARCRRPPRRSDSGFCGISELRSSSWDSSRTPSRPEPSLLHRCVAAVTVWPNALSAGWLAGL